MINALIFDLDGTLADTMPLHFIAWDRTMRKHGLAMTEDRFYELAGVPTLTIVQMLLKESSIELDAAAISREKEQAFLDLLHEVEPIEPMIQLIRQEQGKLPMAVATGAVRPVALQILEKLGLGDSFAAHVCAEDTAKHKPFPDVFLEAAKRLGVPPAQCRVYEDADLGIEAAKRAGMEWVDIRAIHTPRRVTA